ncbi:ATG8-interacting protein 2 isoform X2 [Raphanus sativus]|uniref:ATG8-interacting protein 2 isoform X2 n=1 Tax=Raphanus sativus TaxID=3726 RepID=A0A6J0MIS0_RAPSA|nr:ATG8-interacting protein 2 isoform X2 [Raphanus sativus]
MSVRNGIISPTYIFMADKEEASSGGENTTRGTDWEVVSLTASAYAASPGPKVHDDDVTTTTTPSEAETSHPLYMSGHFVFPPTEPPSALDNNNNKANKKIDSDFSLEPQVGGDLSLEPDEFLGHHAFLDEEKGKRDERNIYKTCLQDEQSSVTPPEQLEDDDVAANSSPWWKRSAASFISQAKETKTVWSIFIAAAVMGVVVLGKRWQHERWQLNWESTIANNEKAGRLMGPISRLKQAFVGGQQRDSFIRSQNDS